MMSKSSRGKTEKRTAPKMKGLVPMPSGVMVSPTMKKSSVPTFKDNRAKGKDMPSRKSVDLAKSVNDVTNNPKGGTPVPGKPKGTMRSANGKIFNTIGHRGTGNPYQAKPGSGYFK